MKAVEFCYWLQGLFELGKPEALTAEQTATVKAHLDMVFIHDIDPSYPAEQLSALDAAHGTKIAQEHLRPKHQNLGDVILRC